jgi:membrane dipeptidase
VKTAEPSTSNTKQAAARSYRDALVADMTLPGMFSGLNDLCTLERYRSCGISVVSITLANDTAHDLQTVLDRAGTVTGAIKERPGELSLLERTGDVAAVKASARLGITFNIQGTNPLAGDLESIARLRGIGVTHMLIAYNVANRVGGGCTDHPDAGLSLFGRAAIEEMNRVGMLVDGSHSGYRTTLQAMELMQRPFIFSHCNAYAVFPHYRNVRDDQIRACAATGGVVGVNGVGAFLSEAGAADAESIFRHIDHIAQLVGAEHAGFGLDFITQAQLFAERVRADASEWPENNGRPVRFDQFAAPEILLEIAELMIRSGYSEAQLRGVLGGNYLRALGRAIG